MIIRSFFEDKKHYKGFYVDVGAHHPVRYSNTCYFYKRGWRGINIEPTPTAIKLFNLIRGRDVNLNIGISTKPGSLKFYCFNEPALNSFSEEVSMKVNESQKYKIIKTVDVEVLPLSQVLSAHVPAGTVIDFLSIDVEGLDYAVLMSNDWEKFQPQYVLIEGHTTVENIGELDVYKFLTQKNYAVVAKTRRTMIFKHQ